MPTETKFDHQLIRRTGRVKAIERTLNHLVVDVQIKQDADWEAGLYRFNVNVWDSKIKIGSRVEVLTGKSKFTPDGEYCEITRLPDGL